MAKVAVVGGGAAGIGAAVQLVKAGMDVTLVDAAPRLGGHCSAVTAHGVEFVEQFRTANYRG